MAKRKRCSLRLSTMAKRKRCSRCFNDFRNRVQVEFKRARLGPAFSDFGIPELDNLIRGRKYDDRFTIVNPPTNSSPSLSISISVYNDKNMEDRISELPNSILHFILSFLETREGARTCILSTRWRYLWTASVSSLNLTYANMFGYDYPKDTTAEFLISKAVKFRQRVDQVLQRCQSSTLDAFRVSYVKSKESTHVDEWINFVAAQRVKELELDFDYIHYPYYYPQNSGDNYRFPFHGFDFSLKYLHLRHCIFEFPCNFKGFRSLVFMKLECLSVMEPVVQNILSSCPSLEWLSLIRCYFSEPLYLKFVDPSLLLKHLHLSCLNAPKGRIDVHDINLLSFELGRSFFLTKVSIKNAPLLTRFVVVDKLNKPFEILSRVTHVETLFTSGWEATLNMHKLPALNNLKQLVLLSVHGDSHFHQLVYFLEVCPSLQKLELDMGLCQNRNIMLSKILIKMFSKPGTPHENLKEVVIYGFEGFPEKVEFARYLLKNAIVLEKMKISSASRVYNADGKWFLFRNILKEGRMSLKRVRKLLQKEINSSTELIIESI